MNLHEQPLREAPDHRWLTAGDRKQRELYHQTLGEHRDTEAQAQAFAAKLVDVDGFPLGYDEAVQTRSDAQAAEYNSMLAKLDACDQLMALTELSDVSRYAYSKAKFADFEKAAASKAKALMAAGVPEVKAKVDAQGIPAVAELRQDSNLARAHQNSPSLTELRKMRDAVRAHVATLAKAL